MNTPPLRTHGSSAPVLMVAITAQRAFGSLVALLAILSIGCSPDATVRDQKFELRINLKSEPDHLNPVLSQQLTSRQIERFLLCPLEDYNPMTLRLEPLLLVDKPHIEVVQEGSQQGKTRYDMQILPEAQWDDGSPVTGYDYLFTMKVGLVPYLSNTAWASFMQILDSIEVDPVDPKHVTVFVDESYMMGEEIVCGFSVYPAHVYDPDSLLHGIAFRTMKDLNFAQIDSSLDQTLHTFADKFNSNVFSRELVQGCGPYRLVEWIANQQIVLEKKSDHWATKLKRKHPILEARPDRLIYYMMSDQQTAFTSLKDGKLDIMAELTPEQLHELSDVKDGRTLRSYSPEVLQYYYIAYNTDHQILSDVRVRKALSHLLDVRAIIDKLFYGYAIPIIGPISPSKPYYHEGLLPIPFNIDSARVLLTAAGWQDGDSDGTLEKTIEGVVVPLKLQIFTAKSGLSQDVAVLLQLQAKKVGIAVEIVPQNPNLYLSMVKKGNYDMAALAVIQSVGDSDPYNSWHSDNAYSEGSNLTKLRNQELDDLIVDLRSSLDEARRAELYLRLQEIIYDQHPALFLMAPKMSLAARADLQMTISTMRPGYFENLTTLQ